MLSAQMILNYWSDATKLGSEPDASLAKKTRHWEASIQEVRAGVLNPETTRALFSAFSADFPHIDYGKRNVPVVLSLKTLVPAKDEAAKDEAVPERPLLLLRAQVRANGILEPTETAPWVPRAALAHDGTRNEALTLCDLDAYRAHQEALVNLPHGDSWNDALRRAEDLFSSVCLTSDETFAEHGMRVEVERVPLMLWEHPDALTKASQLLSRLELTQSVAGSAPLSDPLRQLLNEDAAAGEAREEQGLENVTMEELSDDSLMRYKLLSGSLSDLPSLTEQDRESLFALIQKSERPLVALEAAPASMQDVVCLNYLANTLTDAALRGARVPSMCCVAPRERIASLVTLLSDREQAGMAALPSRWVPRISYEGASGDAGFASRRILGPLPQLCVTYVSSATPGLADTQSALQISAHPEDSAGSVYSDPWYVPKASTYFLDCASSFLGARMRTLEEAAQRLSERLRIVDQDRCELIEVYALVCRAELQMRKRDDIVNKISRLRRRHTELRSRLAFWEELGRTHPLRKLLANTMAPNQSALIRRNAYEGETLALGHALVDDVCEAYRAELDRVESDIDRLRVLSTKLSRRVRSASGEGERCSQLVSRLAQRCGLSAAQSDLLDHAIDGGEVSLANLDQILNETVRASEFWLALHVYEAHWLTACARSEGFTRQAQGEGLAGMQALAHFFPFSFVPSELACGALGAGEGTSAPTANQRLDLVMVMDAHAFDVAEGAAVLAHANKACLVGSAGALAPVQPRGAVFDQMRAEAVLGEGSWDELVERNLASSGASSLFAAALGCAGTAKVPLLNVSASYAEIGELRSELIPAEPLSCMRVPAYGADDPFYPLASIMPVLSHVLVPDSAWEQYGSSRKNTAEAMAIMRWLERHAQEIADECLKCSDADKSAPMVIMAPYKAQAELLRELLEQRTEGWRELVEVCALADAGARSWQVVILSMTCGPDSFKGDCAASVAVLTNCTLAAAEMALVCFCGSSWARSTNESSVSVMGHTLRIGRLFSAPQGPHAAPAENPREKPLALTALLKAMYERKDIPSMPTTEEVNRALRKAGLIKKVKLGKKGGWKPTPAGAEIGIVEETDHAGNPFCTYSTTSEAIVARIVCELQSS